MPDLSLETLHGTHVAGIDEAGRGPWAGPVVAAAVVLPAGFDAHGINDSKKLSARKREALYDHITQNTQWALGIATVDEIDAMNILAATKEAMRRAFSQLTPMPDAALVDGNQPPALPCKTIAVVGGDALSLSIAAASILAKVTRDRMMAALAVEFPGYGWESNAGYGTKSHQDGLAQLGVTPHHRRSFAPIRALLNAHRHVA